VCTPRNLFRPAFFFDEWPSFFTGPILFPLDSPAGPHCTDPLLQLPRLVEPTSSLMVFPFLFFGLSSPGVFETIGLFDSTLTPTGLSSVRDPL